MERPSSRIPIASPCDVQAASRPSNTASCGRLAQLPYCSSVNDRGRQLTDMDKAKALLVLYSNGFLNRGLDTQISEIFGTCFAAYDRIREQAAQSGYKIDLIDRANLYGRRPAPLSLPSLRRF